MKHPLQSPEWASFRAAWGNEVAETPYGFLTLHKMPLTKFKLGIFEKGAKPTKEMLEGLKSFGKENNLFFIKLEPNYVPVAETERESLVKLLKSQGAVQGKTLFTPTTFWIDLTKSEEELLKSLHPKTRYNIRLAEKKGVKVIEDNSDKAFDTYLQLTKETVTRQGFYAHSEKYHRLMWQHLHSTPITEHHTPIAHLLTAKFNNEILTTWIVFVHDNFLYYPYGASTEKHKDLQANSLMMWEAIKFGKKMECITFDLWGREEGKGFTRFKEGFNPKVVEFLGTWDLVINPTIYKIYRFAEKIRWSLLRLRTKFGLIKPSF